MKNTKWLYLLSFSTLLLYPPIQEYAHASNHALHDPHSSDVEADYTDEKQYCFGQIAYDEKDIGLITKNSFQPQQVPDWEMSQILTDPESLPLIRDWQVLPNIFSVDFLNSKLDLKEAVAINLHGILIPNLLNKFYTESLTYIPWGSESTSKEPLWTSQQRKVFEEGFKKRERAKVEKDDEYQPKELKDYLHALNDTHWETKKVKENQVQPNSSEYDKRLPPYASDTHEPAARKLPLRNRKDGSAFFPVLLETPAMQQRAFNYELEINLARLEKYLNLYTKFAEVFSYPQRMYNDYQKMCGHHEVGMAKYFWGVVSFTSWYQWWYATFDKASVIPYAEERFPQLPEPTTIKNPLEKNEQKAELNPIAKPESKQEVKLELEAKADNQKVVVLDPSAKDVWVRAKRLQIIDYFNRTVKKGTDYVGIQLIPDKRQTFKLDQQISDSEQVNQLSPRSTALKRVDKINDLVSDIKNSNNINKPNLLQDLNINSRVNRFKGWWMQAEWCAGLQYFREVALTHSMVLLDLVHRELIKQRFMKGIYKLECVLHDDSPKTQPRVRTPQWVDSSYLWDTVKIDGEEYRWADYKYLHYCKGCDDIIELRKKPQKQNTLLAKEYKRTYSKFKTVLQNLKETIIFWRDQQLLETVFFPSNLPAKQRVLDLTCTLTNCGLEDSVVTPQRKRVWTKKDEWQHKDLELTVPTALEHVNTVDFSGNSLQGVFHTNDGEVNILQTLYLPFSPDNLMNLTLNNNKIVSIAFLERFTNLDTLSLNNNQIQQVDPIFLARFTNLRYLSLSHNQLQNMVVPRSLRALEQLYLVSNNLTSLVFEDNPVNALPVSAGFGSWLWSSQPVAEPKPHQALDILHIARNAFDSDNLEFYQNGNFKLLRNDVKVYRSTKPYDMIVNERWDTLYQTLLPVNNEQLLGEESSSQMGGGGDSVEVIHQYDSDNETLTLLQNKEAI